MQMRRNLPAPRSMRGAFATMAFATLAFAAACDDSSYNGDDGPTVPNDPPPVQPTVVSGSGTLDAKIAEFRTLLGDPNNGATAGEQVAGRREVSWDGAAANPFNNKNDFPASFFNTTARNGIVFTTPGTGFRNDSLKFAEVDSSYAGQFATFSPTKIFSPVGSNQMDVHFEVAGQPTPAVVSGFGAVFSDVDRAGPTKLELFDKTGKSLAVLVAPVRSDAAGLSFIGGKFADAIIARVRITLGDGAIAKGVRDLTAGGTADVVVLDNFLYGEPKAIR
jgi:hypothetical protein